MLLVGYRFREKSKACRKVQENGQVYERTEGI